MTTLKNYPAHRVLALPILLILTFNYGFAQLTKIEKKIITSVEKQNQEALRLWEEVVNINSGTMNFDGVYKVGQVFRAKLDAMGFTTKWVDGKSFGRAGHLIAEHKAKEKKILLIGHLDTVFELNSPFQKFTIVNDSTVSGPGVGDMKGGDVIMLQALSALHQNGLLKDMSIIVVMSGDEELSGEPLSASKHDLIEAAKTADIALGFEDGAGNPKKANISRRSSSDWELKVTGIPSHSSQIFTDKIGAGAIFEASRILNEFYKQLSTEKDLTFNPAVFLGGSTVKFDANTNEGTAFGKGNIVPKEASISGDIRTISPEQLKRAQDVMKIIVANHLPNTDAQITFFEGYPPLAPTPGNYEILKTFDKISLDLGFGSVTAVNPRDAGAADISFTSGYVDAAMDGLGPGSSGGHTINEKANPLTFTRQTKRAALLLYRLSFHK